MPLPTHSCHVSPMAVCLPRLSHVPYSHPMSHGNHTSLWSECKASGLLSQMPPSVNRVWEIQVSLMPHQDSWPQWAAPRSHLQTPYLHLAQVVPHVLEVPVRARADNNCKWGVCAQGFLNYLSSRDLSVSSCPWGKSGPVSLLAFTSNCCIWPCFRSTHNPCSHITYLGSFWASVPLCPFGPTG